jgi:acetyltransferase EpsM
LNVLIIGGGGHAQVIADILRVQADRGDNVCFIGYLDDRAESLRPMLGASVLGTVAQWSSTPHDRLIVAIGDNGTRKRLFDAISGSSGRFAIARHPAAVLAADVCVGPGSMVCAGAIINTQASIGSNCIINTAATVDHHSHIGDHVHVAPGVRLGGEVEIGEGALVGIGAIVLPGRKVGAWATVGAGAVVIVDVAPHTTVVGVPARPVLARSL